MALDLQAETPVVLVTFRIPLWLAFGLLKALQPQTFLRCLKFGAALSFLRNLPAPTQSRFSRLQRRTFNLNATPSHSLKGVP